jgi:amino acid transporter
MSDSKQDSPEGKVHHHHGKNHAKKEGDASPTYTKGVDPPEYVAQRKAFEEQQKQAEHDAAMARILDDDRHQSENQMFDSEMQQQALRQAHETVTTQRALLSVNRDNMIPSYHGWIQYILTTVSGWIVVVGVGIVIGAIWAYFKDLHLTHEEEDNIFFLQILCIIFGFMVFLHGQLGIFAFRKPDKNRKFIVNLALGSYFTVTLVSMFLCLFCVSVIYNTRIEMRDTQMAIQSTYTDPYDRRIGITSSEAWDRGSDGNVQLPDAPPYYYNEKIFARYFNLIFFGAASHDFDDEPGNDACQDTTFITFWYYIRNHCPEILQKENCAHCGEYGVHACGAYEPTCRANFEGTDEDGHYADRNLGCPYQICRSFMIDDGLHKILWMQYLMEALVGMQILICIATIVYAWEYGIYYRTQDEVNECYKPINMQKGIYKKSMDLNDVIVRTDMLSSIIYPSDDHGSDDEADENGRYNHTYRPSEGKEWSGDRHEANRASTGGLPAGNFDTSNTGSRRQTQ